MAATPAPMPAAISVRRSIRPQSQHRSQIRSETGADLRNGAFAASRTSGAERERAGHDFHKRNPRPDQALVIVIRGNGRVGPVSFRFRGDREDQEAAQQAAQRWNEQEHPRTKRRGRLGKQRRFSAGRSWPIAGPVLQRVMKHVLAGEIKDDCPEAGDHSHQHREQHHSALRPKPLGEAPEFGQPLEWVRRDGEV